MKKSILMISVIQVFVVLNCFVSQYLGRITSTTYDFRAELSYTILFNILFGAGICLLDGCVRKLVVYKRIISCIFAVVNLILFVSLFYFRGMFPVYFIILLGYWIVNSVKIKE